MMNNHFEKKFAQIIFTIVLCIMVFGALIISQRNFEINLSIGVYVGSYWGTPGVDTYQILDNAIERFEERYPNVHITYESGIDADDYSEWLAEKLLMGNEPDLFFVLPEDFSLLVRSGALENLDSTIEKDSSFSTDIYYPSCLSAGIYNGSIYAIPYESVPTIMFFNKTLLETKGIEIPDENWTWDDFYSICQAVTDIDQHQYGVYGYTWQDAVYSNGASVFSTDGSSCNLGDEAVVESINFTKKLNDLNEGFTVTARDFDNGNVAFRPFLYADYRAYQPYPWRVKKYTNFEWDAITMPAGPRGDNISEMHTMLIGLSERSMNKWYAWEFAKMLSAEEETQMDLYRYSAGISPLIEVAENEEMIMIIQNDIPGGSVFDQSVVSKIMETAATTPTFSLYSQVMQLTDNVVNEELAATQINRSNLLAAQREINQFLHKNQ